jgi:hypothetical protein
MLPVVKIHKKTTSQNFTTGHKLSLAFIFVFSQDTHQARFCWQPSLDFWLIMVYNGCMKLEKAGVSPPFCLVK